MRNRSCLLRFEASLGDGRCWAVFLRKDDQTVGDRWFFGPASALECMTRWIVGGVAPESVDEAIYEPV